MDEDWDKEGFQNRASSLDLFLLRYKVGSQEKTEWCGSKRSALARFRQVVRKEGGRYAECIRYRCPKFPPSASHRQVALWALSHLGCSEKENLFVRVEAHDPGIG